MTWIELKEFCNGLDGDQLKQNVVVFREEEGIPEVKVDTLSENHYLTNDNDDGCVGEKLALEIAK